MLLIPRPLELIPCLVCFSPGLRQLFCPPSLAKGGYSSSRGRALDGFCQSRRDVLRQSINHRRGCWFVSYRGEGFDYLGFEEIPVRPFKVIHWYLLHSLQLHIECRYNREVI